ncbi:SMP-30/gluconolactonase/LRE family protein [Rahnella sp. FC061912-K]|uniref:SMP-30/gluconolactonase/LRE family protein n=1 Tax=Rahnella rivi TaxID=2816249 RepID=UPI001C281343|nr:SMP-30/gluconolactonase/LRE family protein [Rahnella rivi]MBU9830038.1 SMP-30/gluconolactonase/LRE family protein [Rahnella rivi]
MSALFRSDVTAVGDYRAELGETPVWCQRTQSLLWVDILAQRVLRYWPETKKTEIHDLPSITSAVLLTEKRNLFLLVSIDGIHLYDYDLKSRQTICGYFGAEGTRPNEAAISPDGSLWFGTLDLKEEKNNGAWYRYEAGADAPEMMLDNVGITNTLVWYEGKVWFADTRKNRFYSANARRINPQKISCFSSGDKSPDGSALAQNGWLITACWGSHCLLRQQINQGELLTLDTAPLPVTQPSCCTFGGPDMTELYITSARKTLEAPHALEGALLHVQTSTVGAPQNLFKLQKP